MKDIEISEKNGEYSEYVSISYNNLGLLCYETGKLKEAEQYLLKSLQIKQQTLPLNHPSLGATYNNLALIYEGAQSEEYYKKAVNVFLDNFGGKHQGLGNVYCNMGLFYKKSKFFQKAKDYFSKAYEICLGVYGENSAKTFNYAQNMDF